MEPDIAAGEDLYILVSLLSRVNAKESLAYGELEACTSDELGD